MGKNKQKRLNNKRVTEEERELLEDMFGSDYSSIIRERINIYKRDRSECSEDNPFEQFYKSGME